MLTRFLAKLRPVAVERPTPRARGTRLGVELLEDRLTPNSRFVVPTAVPADNVTTFHTLSAALSTPGLASGDAVQIEQYSSPGTITDADVDAINAPNVTIRGEFGVAPSEQPVIRTSGQIVVESPETGLTFQNVNLRVESLVYFYTNVTLRDSLIVLGPGTTAIEFYGTTAAVVRNNTITGDNNTPSLLYFHNPPTGSANVVHGNTISATTGSTLLSYKVFGVLGAPAPIADVVSNNTFLGSDAWETTDSMLYAFNVDGLTIRDNTFRDQTAEQREVYLVNVMNTRVLNNVIDMTYDATPTGPALEVWSYNGTDAGTTLRGNSFATGSYGTAVSLRFDNFFANPTPTPVLLEGNNFLATPLAVRVITSGGLASRLDLGGGPLGSKGGNNFRKFLSPATAATGAIVVEGGATDTVNARNNLFAVPDPETVIWDRAETNTAADVDATGSLSGNAAFVQALYTRFLKRVGDVTDPADAGYWVNLMTGGMRVVDVANYIVRSAEASWHVLDGLYQKILGRAPEAAERAYYVESISRRGDIEDVQAALYSSEEYRTRHFSNPAFVRSLYVSVLARKSYTPSEISFWANILDENTGRASVVGQFLRSPEHRQQLVDKIYNDLLKRGPDSQPQLVYRKIWVDGMHPLQTLLWLFAGSEEYYLYG